MSEIYLRLSISGVGPVSFPLGEHDARAISGACHRAPFLKVSLEAGALIWFLILKLDASAAGSETIVDGSVRKTWELQIGLIRDQ